jgi:hypothetical protein
MRVRGSLLSSRQEITLRVVFYSTLIACVTLSLLFALQELNPLVKEQIYKRNGDWRMDTLREDIAACTESEGVDASDHAITLLHVIRASARVPCTPLP